MMRKLTIGLVCSVFLAGCQTAQTTISVPQVETEILTADVGGIIIGSSPRLVLSNLESRGFKPSRYSQVTLEDVIAKNDRGNFERDQVIYSKGDDTLSFLDDENFTVQFCAGKAHSIDYSHFAELRRIDSYKRVDTERFSIASPEKPKKSWGKFSLKFRAESQIISVFYRDDGYESFPRNNPMGERVRVFQRRVAVFENASCLRHALRQIR